MKKIICICLLIFSFLAMTKISVSGAENFDEGFGFAYDQTSASAFAPNKVTTSDIYGLNYQAVTGNTYTSGAKNNQFLNVFSMKTDNMRSKLVCWAVQNGNAGYKNTTITKAAQDYEKNHPGWIVLGGINADQYFTSFGNDLAGSGKAYMTPTPYYPMISDGENRFPITQTGNCKNIVGFKNNGESNSFATKTDGVGNFVIEFLDENNEIITNFVVNKINGTPNDGETTVWSSYVGPTSGKIDAFPVSSDANLFIVEKAELAYMSNNEVYEYTNNIKGFNTFFGRGSITKKASSYTLTSGQFAIETKNDAVLKQLEIGKRVRIEQKFNNSDMESCEEGVGYHTAHKVNGTDNKSSASYNTQRYNRALFGKKADGTYVLITADKCDPNKTQGLNFTECNAVAEYYELTDMYQMDGGGSVTAMIRKPDGSFQVTNIPRDSGNPNDPRANLNYLFFVARDAGIRVNESKSTYYSVTLDRKEIATTDVDFENITAQVEGDKEIYSFGDSNTLEIKNLKNNTEYNIIISYDICYNNQRYNQKSSLKVSTKEYNQPNNIFSISSINKNGFTVEKSNLEFKNNINNVIIHVGDLEYNMGDQDSFEVTGLLAGKSYKLEIEYDIYDDLSLQTYHVVEPSTNIKTKTFNFPEIKNFEITKTGTDNITFSYSYEDSDDVVKEAYIYFNDQKYLLYVKEGTKKITKINLEGDYKYDFQLIIAYTSDDGLESEELKSEIITVENKEEQPTKPAETPKKGCKKNSISTIISILGLVSFIAIIKKERNN